MSLALFLSLSPGCSSPAQIGKNISLVQNPDFCFLFIPLAGRALWHKDTDGFELERPGLAEGEDFVYLGKRSHLAPPALGMESLVGSDPGQILPEPGGHGGQGTSLSPQHGMWGGREVESQP